MAAYVASIALETNYHGPVANDRHRTMPPSFRSRTALVRGEERRVHRTVAPGQIKRAARE